MDVVKKDIFANVIEFAMSKGILMKTSRQVCLVKAFLVQFKLYTSWPTPFLFLHCHEQVAKSEIS